MKRAPLFVLAGTAAGLAGILSFHTPAAPTALASPASGAGASTGGSSHGTSNGARRRRFTRSAAAGRSRAGTAGVRTALGATVPYGYGRLTVRVTARQGRITDVSVPFIQVAEQYSQQLASQVIPTLRSEVLSAQAASINGVSGATYTSEAYAKSLQAALDKLHLK